MTASKLLAIAMQPALTASEAKAQANELDRQALAYANTGDLAMAAARMNQAATFRLMASQINGDVLVASQEFRTTADRAFRF